MAVSLAMDAPTGMYTVGVDAEQRRRQRDALGVVAGRRRDHPRARLLLGQPGDAHVGAADLERPGALQVLALEVAPARRPPAASGRDDSIGVYLATPRNSSAAALTSSTVIWSQLGHRCQRGPVPCAASCQSASARSAGHRSPIGRPVRVRHQHHRGRTDQPGFRAQQRVAPPAARTRNPVRHNGYRRPPRGSNNNEPAAATPPPITTRSRSSRVTAPAIAIPSASPERRNAASATLRLERRRPRSPPRCRHRRRSRCPWPTPPSTVHWQWPPGNRFRRRRRPDRPDRRTHGRCARRCRSTPTIARPSRIKPAADAGGDHHPEHVAVAPRRALPVLPHRHRHRVADHPDRHPIALGQPVPHRERPPSRNVDRRHGAGVDVQRRGRAEPDGGNQCRVGEGQAGDLQRGIDDGGQGIEQVLAGSVCAAWRSAARPAPPRSR